MWSEHLDTFDKAVRRAFDFLREERAYSGPEVQYGRDYGLIYAGPSRDLKVSIGWERSWYIPFIFIEAIKTEGSVLVQLQQMLKNLHLAVDTGECALCEKIARKKLPGIREMWLHVRRKRQLLLEYPRFLEVYGGAFRGNYGAVVEQVYREPITIPANKSRIGALSK